MAGGKETPRQKMIGLMYLVLMALLAMNVSKQIINAFVTLNGNIDESNKTVIQSIEGTRQELREKLINPQIGPELREKLQMWSDKADELHKMAQRTANFYIEEAQFMLNEGVAGDWIIKEEGTYYSIKDLVIEDYSKKDDYDTPTRLFVGDDHATINERGTAIKTRLESYRDSLLMMVTDVKDPKTDKQYGWPEGTEIIKKDPLDTAFMDNSDAIKAALENVRPRDRAMVKDIISILTLPEEVPNHDETYPWQAGQFDHAPIVAAAAVFTSLKGRVVQAEKIAMDFFNAQGEAPRFKFNKIDALSFAPTAYINQGDTLGVRVQIAAYDSTAETKIEYWVDDSLAFASNDREAPSYKIVTKTNTFTVGSELGGSVGEHVVYGNIEVEDNGKKKMEPFAPFSYKIGAPTSAIGNAEMNVMYVGYENKIAASGSGYTDVNATCSGCSSWSKQGEVYIAKVSQAGGKATVTVTGKDDKGKSVTIGTQDFRRIPMPRPKVFVAGTDPFASTMSRTALSRAILTSQLVGSPLTIKSSVTGGTVRIEVNGVGKSYQLAGNKIPGDAANIIRQLRPGATVKIDAKTSLGGRTVNPGPTAYTVL